ncbi:MAG: sodium:proton antiporter [Microcella sp.]|uniref:monovalent cation/H+ antiporter complex subunit F n=1 Tax=Microcella sp. TaxID=1913979 RepID=UPI0024CA4C33|nr:monovalent cation/H+ antiporter complex subunit F [Microcella sp.]UYN82496.1 MAG: sodium:proton antiporter [Microcella sp.]
MLVVLHIITGSVLAIAALMLLYRVIVGPSLLDRVIASDVLLTTLIVVVGAEMVMNGHTRTIPLMVVLAAVGVFGSISVARFVTRATDATDVREQGAR